MVEHKNVYLPYYNLCNKSSSEKEGRYTESLERYRCHEVLEQKIWLRVMSHIFVVANKMAKI